MHDDISRALDYLDTVQRGVATRSRPSGPQVPYVPSSVNMSPKNRAQVRAEADDLDEMNRQARLRLLGADWEAQRNRGVVEDRIAGFGGVEDRIDGINGLENGSGGVVAVIVEAEPRVPFALWDRLNELMEGGARGWKNRVFSAAKLSTTLMPHIRCRRGIGLDAVKRLIGIAEGMLELKGVPTVQPKLPKGEKPRVSRSKVRCLPGYRASDELLTETRKLLKVVSQSEVARRCGASRETIWRVMNGSPNMTTRVVEKLRDAAREVAQEKARELLAMAGE